MKKIIVCIFICVYPFMIMAENLVVRKYEPSIYSRVETFYQDGIIIAKWTTDFYYDVEKTGKKIEGKYKYVNIERDGREATGYVNYKDDKVSDKQVVIKYTNGKPMWVLNYKDGVKHGKETWYWEDGSILQTGTYVNGRFEGDVIYYEKGVVIARTSYKNGKLNGKRIEYYPNGNIKYYFTHKDDNFHGLAESFYEDGKIESRTVWKDDKEGPTIMFDRKGNKQTEYVNNTGSPDPKNENKDVIEYWDNGNKRREYKEVNGKIEGVLKEYFMNGNLMKEENYHEGLRNGESKHYNSDDPFLKKEKKQYLSVVYNYVGDKLDGKRITYYQSGEVKSTVSYKNGKEQGEYISYYKNGKTMSEKNYIDGMANGIERKFYENGGIIYEVNNKKGKRNGVLKKYYENGKLFERVKYKNGEIEKYTYESENDPPKGYKHKYGKKGRLIKEVLADAEGGYNGYIDYILNERTGKRMEGKMYDKQNQLIYLLKYNYQPEIFDVKRIEYYDPEGVLRERVVYFYDGGPEYKESFSYSNGYVTTVKQYLTGNKEIKAFTSEISPKTKSDDRISKKKTGNTMKLIAK